MPLDSFEKCLVNSLSKSEVLHYLNIDDCDDDCGDLNYKVCALQALLVDKVWCDTFVGSDLKNKGVEFKKGEGFSHNKLVLKKLLEYLRYAILGENTKFMVIILASLT